MARAKLLEPDILILDEPTSALDPLAAAGVKQLLMDMGRRALLLIVTHDIGLARACNRVLFLRGLGAKGATISADGPPAAFFDDPTNKAEYQFAHVG